MIFQDISTAVAAAMSASAQANPPLPKGGGGRDGRGGQGGNSKQVAVPVNCDRCGKVGRYMWECPERNTYWDTPTACTEDTATKVHRKK